jgi:phenylacetate-CoA ligase
MISRIVEKIGFFLLSKRSTEKHENESVKYALSIFSRTLRSAPAYLTFLQENNSELNDVSTIEAFKNLPIIDKKNYLQKYPIEDLCLDGTLKDKYLIEGSSGLSGSRSYWPRIKSDDKKLPARVDSLFRRRFHIDRKPTLVIVGLMMGIWVSGEKIS